MAETAKPKSTPAGIAIKLHQRQEGAAMAGRVSSVTVNGESIPGLSAHIASHTEGATSHDVLVLSIRLDKVTVETAE